MLLDAYLAFIIFFFLANLCMVISCIIQSDFKAELRQVYYENDFFILATATLGLLTFGGWTLIYWDVRGEL